MSRTLLAVACALLLAACSGAPPAENQKADIGKITDVKSGFGSDFKVTTLPPTGIDPRLLVPQPLPQGATFDPPGCAKFATALTVPAGLKGNMSSVTAEGAGNRFIAIAVETSEPVVVTEPSADCQKIAFAGGGTRGLVEVATSPTIEGVKTLGTHRFVQAMANGKPASGELYNYVATFGSFLVIVTANPLVLPNTPVAPVDTKRARDLLVAAVTAVRGT